MPISRHLRTWLFALAAAWSAVAVQPALAHPHVLVDAKAEIVFDGDGQITAIRQIWQFDQAFTAFAVQGLDANGDGQLTDDELEPLAKVNVESLSEYDFFTYLTIGGKDQEFVQPDEYWLQFHDGRLTLFYTLPLKSPAKVDAQVMLEIFDPEYFVAFTFLPDDPVKLDGAPSTCAATYHPPQELDAQTMTILGAIPADQRELPPALVEAASVLANTVTVDCG